MLSRDFWCLSLDFEQEPTCHMIEWEIKELSGKLWVWARRVRELRSVTNLHPVRDSKENQVRWAYMWMAGKDQDEGPRLWRGGYRGRLDEPCGGAELKTHTSDHESHYWGCCRHNGMQDHLTGEGKHWWLATTQLSSINNSIDFDSVVQ